MTNNGKEIKGLMMFDFLVNTDIGLIKFIREHMRDERAFKLEVIDDKSDRELLSLLYSRITTNPLEIITTEENAENIPKLYQSFRANYYKEMLLNSYVDQSMYDFVRLCSDNVSGVSLSICTMSKEEDIFIKKIFNKKIDICSINDMDVILTKDPYYIKDPSFFYDLGLYKTVRCKNIYMPPALYNYLYIEHTNDHFKNLNVFKFIGDHYQKEGENYERDSKSNTGEEL